MAPYKLGYTTGVFDLFHVGHLNILESSRRCCDRLIVGVSTDDLVFKLKGRYPIIPFEERIRIVRALKVVDDAVAEDSEDKLAAHSAIGFDVTFKGDDWKGTDKWKNLEYEFAKLGVTVEYFPYTKGTSSTTIRKVISVYS